jgi:tubulin--tyrosine ligase
VLTFTDGPPSTESSPYILDFVRKLQDAGHKVSVCLPDVNKSWIGKALLVGKSVRPSFYKPPPRPASETDHSHVDQGTYSKVPFENLDPNEEEWILINSTPAACAQLGLFHLFEDQGPIDLVVSGPNYGRNTTSVFALSSGTLGGALEAAVCGKRAIALSYAFTKKDHHEPEIIAAASRMSVRVIDHLAQDWNSEAHVYSVNVPLISGVEQAKVLRTYMLQNQWKSSCFTPVEISEEEDMDANESEARIRRDEERSEADTSAPEHTSGSQAKRTHFRWSPRFFDVHETVKKSAPGNDGWAVNNDHIR